MPVTTSRRLRRSSRHRGATIVAAILLCSASTSTAIHHMKTIPPQRSLNTRADTNTPLVISNQCSDTLYPAILTQSGTGPGTGGFELTSGSNKSMTVSADWQGRVWGRSNCTFSGSSGQCGSGDCGGQLSCTGTGQVPTTLAEFTLNAGDGHTYYDLSLVDGYNLPLAILMLSTNSSFDTIPRNLTNPSCIGTVGYLASQDFYPYTSGSGIFLGTNSSDPLPFETKTTLSEVAQWCPWNLQVSSSTSPSGGVYIYPDGNLNRPAFDPCYSACSKWNLPADCCTGQYGSASSCAPSQYSKSAKSVCPDAYSYAFDDQTSTFIVPSGPGFEVVFCPGGRSTNIIATSNGALIQLTQNLLYNIDVPVFLGSIGSSTREMFTSDKDAASSPIYTISADNTKIHGPASFDSLPSPVHPDESSAPDQTNPIFESGIKVVFSSTAAARPTLSWPEMSFLSQWHGTGFWVNGTRSGGSPSADLGARSWVLIFSCALMGFLLWFAW